MFHVKWLIILWEIRIYISVHKFVFTRFLDVVVSYWSCSLDLHCMLFIERNDVFDSMFWTVKFFTISGFQWWWLLLFLKPWTCSAICMTCFFDLWSCVCCMNITVFAIAVCVLLFEIRGWQWTRWWYTVTTTNPNTAREPRNCEARLALGYCFPCTLLLDWLRANHNISIACPKRIVWLSEKVNYKNATVDSHVDHLPCYVILSCYNYSLIFHNSFLSQF